VEQEKGEGERREQKGGVSVDPAHTNTYTVPLMPELHAADLSSLITFRARVISRLINSINHCIAADVDRHSPITRGVSTQRPADVQMKVLEKRYHTGPPAVTKGRHDDKVCESR